MESRIVSLASLMLTTIPLCIPLEGTLPNPATRIWPLSPTSAMRVQTLVVPTSIAEIILFLLTNPPSD